MRSKFYNPVDNPYRRLAMMVQCNMGKDIPVLRRKTRLMVTQLLAKSDKKLKTSREIPQETVELILDKYFPDWRIAEPITPPKATQEMIRDLALKCNYLLIQESQY